MKSCCPRHSPFVCGGWGGGVTNDWCIIHLNKDEILDKVLWFLCIGESLSICPFLKNNGHEAPNFQNGQIRGFSPT